MVNAPNGSGGQNSSPASNEKQIFEFFQKDMGLSNAQDAGVLGNAEVESTFSPTAYNPSEGAIGIFQWELGRRTALQDYAKRHGLTEDDLSAQLGYARQELLGPFRSVLRRIRSTNNPAEAAAIWDSDYEKSSGSTHQQRMNDATQIYQEIQKGDFSGSKLPPNVPGGGMDPNSPGGSRNRSGNSQWPPYFGPAALQKEGTIQMAGGGILQDIVGIGEGISSGAAQAIAHNPITMGLDILAAPFKIIAQFFQDLLWIFNTDNFMKFLLYVFGTIFVVVGLGLVTFGAGHNPEGMFG